MRKNTHKETTTLYLHGLESNIEGTEKLKFLSQYFSDDGLIAEDIDYSDSSAFDEYVELAKSGNIETFIGSSAGGASAIVLAQIAKKMNPDKKIQVLAFNPAIVKIPDYLSRYRAISSCFGDIKDLWNPEISYHLCLGIYDDVISPTLTLNHIRENASGQNNIGISMLPIKHRIPVLEFIGQIDDNL